jgi:molecular chaperone DnaK
VPKVIGIDLGTSYACIASVDSATTDPASILAASDRERRLPAIVAYCDDGEVLLGSSARRQKLTNATYTLTGMKDLVGLPQTAPQVQRLAGRAAYPVVEGPQGAAWLQAPTGPRSPVEVLAHLLIGLKKLVDEQLGESVGCTVLTLPPHFSLGQRRAVCDAANLAKLPIDRLVDDCTAIAVGSGLCAAPTKQTVALLDAGGGRFAVSIMRCGENSCRTLSHVDDPSAGGEAYTQRLADHLCEEFTRNHAMDLRADPVALQRVHDAAEKLKVQLGEGKDGEISLPFLSADAQGPKHLASVMGRQTCESLCLPLLERSVAALDAALREAKLQPADLDAWALVGGGAQLPGLLGRLQERLQRPPTELESVDELAACGAARLAQQLLPDSPSLELQEAKNPQLYAGTAAKIQVRGQLDPAEFAAAELRLYPAPPEPRVDEASPAAADSSPHVG